MFITEYDRFANQIVVNDSIPEHTSQVTHFMVEFPFSVRMTWASNQLFKCSEQVDNKSFHKDFFETQQTFHKLYLLTSWNDEQNCTVTAVCVILFILSFINVIFDWLSTTYFVTFTNYVFWNVLFILPMC